jgi:hypothetical protein
MRKTSFVAINAGYHDGLPVSGKKLTKPLTAAERSARARKAARARWGPPKRRKKNAAASALAKLRWARASEEEIRASVSRMVEARRRLKESRLIEL